jgi:hypothetical protein
VAGVRGAASRDAFPAGRAARSKKRSSSTGTGGNDPCPAFPFGLGLPRHRALHRLGQRDVLDLDPLHPDSPRFLSGLVDDLLEMGVDLIPLGQQLVHVAVADHRPQRRLSHLGHREGVILHVEDRLDRVHDPVVDHGVHLERDIVPGDGLLGRHRRRDDLHVHLAEPIRDRVHPGQARLADARQQPAPAEDDASLELGDDLEAEHAGHPNPRRVARRATRTAGGAGLAASVRVALALRSSSHAGEIKPKRARTD